MEDFKKFLKEGPLYETIIMAGTDAANLLWFAQAEKDNVAYCPACNTETTWRIVAPIPNVYAISSVGQQLNAGRLGYLAVYFNHLEFKCARDQVHLARFGIEVTEAGPRTHNGTVIGGARFLKFGQLPSLADIAASELDAYRAFIDAADLRELNRVVGLAAHGIGIGSFV